MYMYVCVYIIMCIYIYIYIYIARKEIPLHQSILDAVIHKPFHYHAAPIYLRYFVSIDGARAHPCGSSIPRRAAFSFQGDAIWSKHRSVSRADGIPFERDPRGVFLSLAYCTRSSSVSKETRRSASSSFKRARFRGSPS